jgi:hypothetical protein
MHRSLKCNASVPPSSHTTAGHDEPAPRYYEAGAPAHSDVDIGYLDRRVHDLVTQSDRHLRAIGG